MKVFALLIPMVAVLGLAPLRAQQISPPSVRLDVNEVVIEWTPSADIALQRSPGFHEGWETVALSLGQGVWREPRGTGFLAYRLARYSVPNVTLLELENRVSQMATNQLRRAIDPLAPSDADFGEVPPDKQEQDAEGHRDGAYAWSSQPGLIRVYDVDHPDQTQAYALFSTSDSILSTSEERAKAIAEASRWQVTPERYVDMNAPQAEGGRIRYPILDPRLKSEDHVEGLDFERDKMLGADNDASLPMPVPWLYVLKDGSMGELGASGVWEGNGTVSEANPIVARVAWWMDDETAKVNINTASEGLYWDLPRANTPLEVEYAKRQPTRGEIQRYPGHPAMTSLSALLFPGKHEDAAATIQRLSHEEIELIYALTPRVRYGGTVREFSANAPVVLDQDPYYAQGEDWAAKGMLLNPERGERWHRLLGLVATTNASPEVSLLGRPRVSIWPLDRFHDPSTRSPYDVASATLATLGEREFAYLRGNPASRHEEFYSGAARHNVKLYQYVMGQVYAPIPGYGGSLATKYGARLATMDYANDLDYDKDHYQILLSWFNRIRSTDLLDPDLDDPYSAAFGTFFGSGNVVPLSLMGRDLANDDGDTDAESRGHLPSLEPYAPGRGFTLTELGLVVYCTGQVTLADWSGGSPRFTNGSGADTAVIQRILSNQHPEYARWIGRKFGPEDSGKAFRYLEVGLIPEVYSPAYGYGKVQPSFGLGLLNEGSSSYLGGLSERSGLKINGIPISLWGRDRDHPGVLQALAVDTSVAVSFDAPNGWAPFGGQDVRMMRFGQFQITAVDEGFHGVEFLANGVGPLRGWYCQTPVIVREDELLEITQEAPIQMEVYDIGALPESATAQIFHLRFAEPGETRVVDAPLLNSASYQNWTRRFSPAVVSPIEKAVSLTSTREAIKGLSVSHGDYRHVASKRIVPSELVTHHPMAETRLASHSLAWAVQGGGGNRIEPTVLLASDVYGRGLVEGVDYDPGIEPDFVSNPYDRDHYAPLLGDQYHFAIDPTWTRDFDNGFAMQPDGAFMNKPDDGMNAESAGITIFAGVPYFTPDPFKPGESTKPDPEHHFARRMAPSPVAFGSIPSAVQANAPWTCLLFRPNVSDPSRHPHLGERGNGMIWEANRKTMDGLDVPQMASVRNDPRLPADHLWLDLFWMPSAVPDDLNAPFSTEGKVNMNYQLFPFPYIKRATALHAVMKSEKIMAIPTSAGRTYKAAGAVNPDWRYTIDAEETLKGFEARFATDQSFLSESQICEQFLIPEGQRWDAEGKNMRAFWDEHRLTGDNTLERPYAGLYSRLTTRSNVYRLHMRLEAIQKALGSPVNSFDPERDRVVGARRGSVIITRRLQSQNVPDYVTGGYSDFSADRRLERFYRYDLRDRSMKWGVGPTN